MSYNKETKKHEGYIYCIENNLNNSKYIGQTIFTPYKRFKEHKFASKNIRDNNYFHNALRKYGFQNFSISTLEVVTAKTLQKLHDSLNKKEIDHIKNYNTVLPNGYNTAPGGKSVSTPMPIDHYDYLGSCIKNYDSLQEASEINDISLSAIWLCCNGYNARTSRGIFRYKGESFNKYVTLKSCEIPVVCYDLQGNFIKEYNSITKAAIAVGATAIQISEACNGVQYTSKGYVWRFKGDSFNKHKVITNIIVQYDLNCNRITEYDSAAEASRKTGICKTTINKCCRGLSTHAGGYLWARKNHKPILINNGNFTPVNQYSLIGEYVATFESIKNASDATNTNPSSISQCCTGKYKTAGGYVWKYI